MVRSQHYRTDTFRVRDIACSVSGEEYLYQATTTVNSTFLYKADAKELTLMVHPFFEGSFYFVYCAIGYVPNWYTTARLAVVRVLSVCA